MNPFRKRSRKIEMDYRRCPACSRHNYGILLSFNPSQKEYFCRRCGYSDFSYGYWWDIKHFFERVFS